MEHTQQTETGSELTAHHVSDHFVDVNKMIQLAKGAKHIVKKTGYPGWRLNHNPI